MEQHPIPQQISSYEFKLVGEMTLKQFLKAAAGIVLAILINTTKLIIIVKWPLMLLFAGTGLLLAFVPFEDRPLETWIIAFIKAIYSPTIYTYKKNVGKNWLEIDSIKKSKGEDEAEKPVENQNVFVSANKQTNGAISQHKLRDMVDSLTVSEVREKTAKEKKMVENNGVEIKNKVSEVPTKEEVGARGGVKEQAKSDWRDQKVDLNLKTEKLGATGEAVFGAIPMPDRPEIGNLIVGMATNVEGKIIDGVIVEIQDEHGSPSRVIKTNSLGQFKISTPLADGRYLIIAEKDGYNFDRVNIDLGGQIVEPIRIIAHN